MKSLKYFIFFLLIATSSEIVFAQNYEIPIGRRYIMRSYNPFVYPLYGDKIYYYDAIADTTINGNKYTVISPGIGYDDLSYIRWDGTKCIRYLQRLQRDSLVFDEAWEIGDTIKHHIEQTIVETGYLQGRKYWKGLVGFTWVQGVGEIPRPPFYIEFDLMSSYADVLICCIEANGDTLYVNRDILHFIQTDINNLSADNITITPTDGGCFVTLDTYTVEWTATIYNSNGVTVAQQQGNGSEIFLPTYSKGTHILVVKAGGRVVKKKIMLR